MDFKYNQDDDDLSVGLSVTCSTTVDDCYTIIGPDGLSQENASPYSPYTIGCISENNPQTSSGSNLQIPEFHFGQTLLQGDYDESGNNCEELKSDVGSGISLDKRDLTRYKRDASRKSKRKTAVVPRVKKVRKSSQSSSKNVHSEAQKMQVCKTCGKTFKFQTSLLRHNNKVHFSRYQCSACCRVFSRQSYLDVHTSKPGSSCFIQHKIKNKRRKRKSSIL